MPIIGKFYEDTDGKKRIKKPKQPKENKFSAPGLVKKIKKRKNDRQKLIDESFKD